MSRPQLHSLPHQQRCLDVFIRTFEPEPDVIAAVLLGSLAGGTGDRLSDADLLVFTRNGLHQQCDPLFEAFEQQMDVLYQLNGDHNSQAVFRKYIFADCTSAEIHCADREEPFEIARPYITLFDKIGIVAQRLSDADAPSHQDFTVNEWGDDGLIWELLTCIKWLSRGRTGLAKRYLKRLGEAL